MGSKKAGSTLKNPSQKRYTAEKRWEKNKAKSAERGEKERKRAAAKHERKGTLGHGARRLERSQSYALRVIEKKATLAAESANVQEA